VVRAYKFGRNGDNRSVESIETVLAELLSTTHASRATLRRDVDGPAPFPVVAEALAHGVGSLRGEVTVHLPTQPVVREVQQGRQVVQDDCRTAYDDPSFQAMLAAYGGLRAQIVTPVLVGARLEAIMSLHQLGEPRIWTEAEIAAATAAAERIRGLL
jgi:GAF domain-containing protein